MKKFLQRYKQQENQLKELFKIAKKSGQKLTDIKKTKQWKDIQRRKKNAEYYYKNRKKILKERRDKRAAEKSVNKIQSGNKFKNFGSQTVFEAYSGKGRIFEAGLLSKYSKYKFAGTIEILPSEDNEKTYSYSDYEKFRRKISKILSKLYNKEGSIYEAFFWEVDRSYFVDEKRKTLFLFYTFTENR